MTLALVETYGLGSRRIVEYDEALHSDAMVLAASSIAARTLSVGMRGFDTSQKLTLANYQWARANGFDFAVRYVPLAGQSPAIGIDANEFAACLSSGLGLMLVQFSRTSNLTPQQGHDDGETFVLRAKTLGYPMIASMWGDFFPADAATMKAYGNAEYAATTSYGADPYAFGGYNEPGVPATLNLYKDYNFHRYWRSGAHVPDAAPRGPCLSQLWPGNRLVGPATARFVIDYDDACGDWMGGYPVAAFAA